jgi:ketosteroid isomerase-like protein
MKRFTSIAALLCLFACSPVHLAAKDKDKSGDESAQIRAIEQQWLTAYLKGDASFLEKIEADDFALFDPSGAAHSKADDVRDVKTGAMKWTEARFEDVKVRVYGKTAVATGVATIKGTYNGQDMSGRYRFTDVFVRKKEEWHAVSSQLTPVK